MSETLQTTDVVTSDADLLDRTATAVRAAGAALRERFGDVVRYETRDELMRALAVNDDTALDILRPRLTSLRPEAGWVEDELDGGALPPGEWWVVDPAEGNVNHLHALPEWAVTATLVRENQPVLTAVHLPLTGETYTALTGAGAHLDGRPLRVSPTADLGLSIVATSEPAGRGREGRTARRLLDHRDALRRARRPHRRARDPAPHERGRRPHRRLLAVRRRPSGPAARRAARHRGRRTDLRRRGPPLDPAERELPGRRARRPRRSRRHALPLTPHTTTRTHARTRTS